MSKLKVENIKKLEKAFKSAPTQFKSAACQAFKSIAFDMQAIATERQQKVFQAVHKNQMKEMRARILQGVGKELEKKYGV